MATKNVILTDPADLNITFYRGNSVDLYDIPLTWEDGSSIDLSIYTSGIMSVKKKSKDTTDILTFSTSDSSLIIGSSKITLDKDASDMLVDARDYVYDIRLYDASDNAKTFVKGIVTVEQNVSYP